MIMCVIAELPPEEVLPFTSLAAEDQVYSFHGVDYEVHMDSLRYATFAQNLCCVECGLRGSIMRLEHDRGYKGNGKHRYQSAPRAHFNLYAILPDGRAVLMTRDHIIPKSKGGGNGVSNSQTMCETCNFRKSDKMPTAHKQLAPEIAVGA